MVLTRVTRGAVVVPCLATALLSVSLAAQEKPQSSGIQPVLTVRTRVESWDWFGADPAESYTYSHALVRFGLARPSPALGWRVEFAAPVVFGLPADATQGHGAAYYRANDRQRTVARMFPKQVYVTLGGAAVGHRARAGRFEFSEGGEVTPTDPWLAAVKRSSVMQRLIGPFNFTQGARSLDGVEYGWRGRRVNVALLAAVPTVGVFNLEGTGHLGRMPLGYGALTGRMPWNSPGEWRMFAAALRDDRGLPRVDNRPLPARTADTEPITVVSTGGHLLQILPTAAGPVDVAVWGVRQSGSWGLQRHAAWAGDAEIGWRPRAVAWAPWLRAGYFRTSGDRDPADATHGTFYQTLATPRLFARFPFYNLTNVRDGWASVSVRPARALVVRGDVRRVALGDSRDGWYQGSGPFDGSSVGLAYRASGGHRDLGTLVDLSADYQLGSRWAVSAYAGSARAGPVIGAASAGRFGFVEVEYRR